MTRSDSSVFVFTDADILGRVTSVDTNRVVVDATNSTLLTHIVIGNLVAIQGSITSEYLIAITERVTRSQNDILLDEDGQDDLLLPTTQPVDSLRCTLIGTFRSVEGDKKNTFKRGADSFPQIDRVCYIIQDGNLGRFMNIMGADIPEGERLKLGYFVVNKSAEAIANGDKFFQRHAAVLGSTGSGKSWAVALILERAAKLKHPNIIVFDMHGEYAPLADNSEGNSFAQQLRIAGPGDLGNQREEVLYLPYWLLNKDEMLSMMLDRSDQNAPNQASRFTLHVRELKEKTLRAESKEDVLKTFTVDSPIPYKINELVEKLHVDDTTKGIGANRQPIKGDWEGKLTRFLSRLKAKLEDRRYGFMFSPTEEANEYGWLARQIERLLNSSKENRGIKIIDFSEVPADVLPIVTGTLARLLYNVQFWMAPSKRTPVTLLCDEAHLYLPLKDNADAVERQALETFERIAKEGRKYGFSILVVSQRPSDVSKTILSQCNNFLALRLTNETDQGVIKRLIPDSLTSLTSVLPLLDTGEAILLGDAVILPSRIKLDVPSVTPDSATRDFWKEWGKLEPDKKALEDAVESLRKQTRTI
jgi:DNA helicase HerA-like ATPase